MPLDSTSTINDWIAEYVDTSDYMAKSSAAICQRFIRACIVLLIKIPAEAEAVGKQRIRMSPDQIAAQLDNAWRWLAANENNLTDSAVSGAGRSYFDLSGFRS